MPHSLPSYAIVEHYGDIEEKLWQNGCASSARSVCTALRHRFWVLYLTAAVLRCESIYAADLSDFQGICMDQNENDVHPIFVMIMQFAAGKTNHGKIRYGRAIRHKNPKLCCIGALSFYLMLRFAITGEFAQFTVDDWCNNKAWFDVKLLVDVNSKFLLHQHLILICLLYLPALHSSLCALPYLSFCYSTRGWLACLLYSWTARFAFFALLVLF